MNQKILLADDDEEDWEILLEAFKELNAEHAIHFKENGREIVTLLESTVEKDFPSLIVLDLNMPVLNGTETLKILKTNKKFRHIPVIIYSTSINPFEKDKCLLLGAERYITKPVSFKESIETARFFLNYEVQN